MTESKQPKVFISYAWEEDTKTWAHEFSTRLRSDGVDTILDQWHVIPGDSLPEFMEKSVSESDFVLVICTPTYKKKSESEHPSGVVYEKGVITGELFVKRNQRKFIPILQKGKWQNSAPSWILAKTYVDLSDNPYSENNYIDLLQTLYSEREFAPPLGSKPDFSKPVTKQKKRIKPVFVKKNSPRSKRTNIFVETIKTNVQKIVFGVALVGFASLAAFGLPSLFAQEKSSPDFISTQASTETVNFAPSIALTSPTPTKTNTPTKTASPTIISTRTFTPTATLSDPFDVGWLISFSKDGVLTLVDINSQQSENLLEVPDCNEEPLWYPEEQIFVICSRLFEFDMGKADELPTSLPEHTKDKVSLLDKVIYSTEPTSWYNGVSSIISIDMPTNTKEWIVNFEVTDVTNEKVTQSEFIDTYTKQVVDLISVSPSNAYLLFTRTPMVVQEKHSNINGVVPENPYAILQINPTKFFSINLSSKELRELYCDKFYYWNAQSDTITCENGSHVIATASRTNSPYSVLDEFQIDFSSWSSNFHYMGFISDGNLYVYDIEQGTVIQLAKSNNFVDFTWLSNSNYLVAVNGDIYFFDANSGQVMSSLETPGEDISAMWMQGE